MPKTISATDNLLHSAFPPDVRRQAGDLMLVLAAVECHASVGELAPLLPAVLRDLVILTTKLAGRTWLEANTDRAAAFTALQATMQPPPLPELDQILARLLLDRFRLPQSQTATQPWVQSSPVFRKVTKLPRPGAGPGEVDRMRRPQGSLDAAAGRGQ